MAVTLGIKNIGLFDTDKEEIQKISLEEDEGENQDDIINTNIDGVGNSVYVDA